jgi:sortase A
MKKRLKSKKKIGTVLSFTGLIMIVTAFVIWGCNLLDDKRAGDTAYAIEERMDYKIETTENGFENDDLYKKYPQVEMPVISIDNQDYIGQIDIPDLNLSLPVADSWSYAKLKNSPCRYSGSAYLKNMTIAAHNYSRHFGNIKKLQIGSPVVFTDIDKHQFSYTVAEVEEVKPTDIEQMKEGDWDLTLFTCNKSGKMRVAVRCVEAETYPEDNNA